MNEMRDEAIPAKGITVIGSMNMDMVVHTPRLPALGETLLGSGFHTVPGGKGANQAVAIARLGDDVAMVGCVGNDAFGGQLAANLSANGVDISQVRRTDDCATGTAMILVKDGDNCIIVDPGANGHVDNEAIDRAEDCIRGSAMVVLQLEIPLSTVEHALRLAHKHGVPVLLNPAPAVPLTPEILKLVDVITPNESECEILTGRKIAGIDDAIEAARHLAGFGVGTVVVTLGENGAVALQGDECFHVPAHKIVPVDTTAAGDSFTGALALSLTQGKSLRESLQFATRVASITVTRHGAQSSLPHLSELEMR